MGNWPRDLPRGLPREWPAGSLATTRLQALTAGRPIVCQEKDRDRYGRIVAICRANGEDLAAIMVREGLAWAFTRFSVEYVDEQEEARRANRGMHAHDARLRRSGGRRSAQETATSA